MITLALLKFIENAGLGVIDTDLFWQNIGIDDDGIYIVNIGQPRARGTRSRQQYEIYARSDSKINGLEKLEAISELINNSYDVCVLPSAPTHGLTHSYNNVTLLPTSSPTRVGMDSNDRILWSISGTIIY